MKSFKTVRSECSAEFTEKKSVFIGYIRPVSSEDEAQSFISGIKKKHADATHNVYAYILEGTEFARFSDDGEPSGTAGMPVLEVIKREGLTGVVVVVTRYFGGILLGAGGLVRAYAKAAKLAIDTSGVCEFRPFTVFELSLDYSDYEKIRKELDRFSVKLDDTQFSDRVVMTLAVDSEKFCAFDSFVTDYTCAKSKCNIISERFDAE